MCIAKLYLYMSGTVVDYDKGLFVKPEWIMITDSFTITGMQSRTAPGRLTSLRRSRSVGLYMWNSRSVEYCM